MTTTITHPAPDPAVQLLAALLTAQHSPDEPGQHGRHRYVSLEAAAAGGHEVGIGDEDKLHELIDGLAAELRPRVEMTGDSVGEITIPMLTSVEDIADRLAFAEGPDASISLAPSRAAEHKLRAAQQKLQRYKLAEVVVGTKDWVLTIEAGHAAELSPCVRQRRQELLDAARALAGK